MVAVYLLSCLADLLDHEEVSFGLDNPFDSRLLMSGDDDEVVALPHDRRIAGGRNFDRLQTRTSPALAVEAQGNGDLMLLRASSIRSFTPRKTSSLRAARSADIGGPIAAVREKPFPPAPRLFAVARRIGGGRRRSGSG